MEAMKNDLWRLCQAQGLPGREEAAANEIKLILKEMGLTPESDAMGNVWATFGQGEEHLLLDAHLDQIGLLVTGFEKGGFLRVGKSGGIDRRVLLGTPVVIHGRKTLRGIVCCMPPHLTKGGEDEVPELEDMAIDTGLSDDELEKTVRLGDSVTFLAPITQLMGTRVTGAALDDRTGCAVLLRCAQLLKGQDMPRKVTVLFSSREEVGSQGAQTAAFRLKPDACIAVDVTFATQPGVSDKEGGKLGGGPMVGLSPVLSRRMAQKLFDLAKREQISVQTEVMEGRTGTTADSILTTRQGVPCCLLSIPQRSMHTPAEVCDLQDMEQAAQLLAAYAKEA